MEKRKEIEKRNREEVHSARKKWKQVIAMVLSVLMVTSVIDYSGFINVNAQTQTVALLTATAEDGEASVTDSAGAVTYYGTIEEAITAAQSMSGCTVTLLKDVQTESFFTISSGTFTIDLSGNTWHCTYIYGMALNLEGSADSPVSITFKDSVGNGNFTTDGTYSVYKQGYASVVFEGGNYTGIYCFGNVGELLAGGYIYRNNSDGSVVTDTSGKKITNVTVTPAPVKITAQPEDAVAAPGYTEAEAPTFTVTAQTVPADSGNEITYQWYKNSAAISGATSASYTAETGLADGTYTYYCAVTCEGYTVNSDNATLYVTSAEGNYEVTSSGGLTFKYPTLETAITAAKSKPNSTVKLLADATTASKVEVSSGTFTIDLNGKTWTSTASDAALYLTNGSHVTLMDSVTGGKLTTSTAQNTIFVESTDLTIKSGIYENENSNYTSYVLVAYFSGTITIQGGTIQTSKSIMNLVYLQSVDVVISGGTFSGPKTAFDACASVALSGGEYSYISTNNTTIVANLLASGYGFKNKSDNTWVNNLGRDKDYYNDLANYSLTKAVTVQPVPVQTTAQPQATSATYGYTTATMSVTAVKTSAAPEGSSISYRWYRVKSGTETSDTAVGANSSTLTIPTGLDTGTHSFYCVVTCDGYILNSQSATFTVEKATPTISLDVSVYEDDPFMYGKLMYLTATVTGANGESLDGTVTFMDGGNVLAADVAYSTYSFYQKGLDDVPAGNHSFTAVYTPSDGTGKNYVGVTSAALEQAIAKADQNALSINEVTGKKYGDDAFALETTGGSGTGEVTYSVPEDNGVLSVSGSTATIIGAGTVTVTATNAADDNYKSITATREITIAKAPAPGITFPTTAEGITYGQKLSASTLSGGTTEYGSFAWTNGNTVPTVGDSDYEVTFTPSADTAANYEAISDTTDMLAVSVSKSTPAVTVNAVVSRNPEDRTATLTTTVTGAGDGEAPSGTVTFVNSTSGSDVDIAGATAVSVTGGKATYTWTGLASQVYKVRAVYSGDGNYNTVTSTEFSFDTNKQNQAVFNIESIATKTYGDSSFTLSTAGGSGDGAVSFASSDSTVVSISGNTATIHKAGTVTITATKAADNAYLETTASAELTIAKANIAKAAVSGITSKNYTGKAIGQSGLTVKLNGKTLKNGTDYTVSYKNNLKIGTAVLTITGKGIYTGTVEKNFQIKVSKGTVYTVDSLKYKITDAKTNGAGTVTLTGSTKSKSALKGTLKIGDTVKIGGKSFKITAIGDKAFKGYTKLTKVTVGKNVSTIGKETFSGCSKVTSVTIGTGLKTISTKAFYNCKTLKTITISSKQLKTVGKDAIKKVSNKAVIKVASSKVSAYKKVFKSSTGFTGSMKLKK